MLPSPVCSVSPVSGRFPEEESSEPPTGLKATYPVSPSDWAYVAFSVPGDRAYVAFSAQRQVVLPPLPFSLYCTRGTCASSLLRSHTSRSPGAWHLRACPVREVVTITWDPCLREPVEGVLRATSVLELAAA
ncbi:hypothetical protein Taro_008838 [Colocasia esculenta]|uniref:Uncharacterized protein n=1 Tax=Colocasia esculenta TaxID=4460 RepID=A0A843U2A1_COLES|nr:hypothetical protein [Colocasia esculenta]